MHDYISGSSNANGEEIFIFDCLSGAISHLEGLLESGFAADELVLYTAKQMTFKADLTIKAVVEI